MDNTKTQNIVGDSVDELVLKGLAYIRESGEKVSARGLSGIQAFNVNYILTNPKNRVHTLRIPNSINYFAKEVIIFLSGSLKAADLAVASQSWLDRADENGNIASNYGYHIFHQKTPEGNFQYDWVVNLIENERQTRRAIININQVEHKISESKDMPCAISAHFFIQQNNLCCVVSARSTDIITGLCYNMGFFSLVTELLWADLKERGVKDLGLGYCMIKSNLTQLYDNQYKRTNEIDEKHGHYEGFEKYQMPSITSAKDVLNDIYHNTKKSPIMKWCVENS